MDLDQLAEDNRRLSTTEGDYQDGREGKGAAG
jgi:hypothetical protein